VLLKHGHWLLAALALGVYAPTLANGLTAWDDPTYTTESPFVTEGLSGLATAFTRAWDGAWVPLTHVALTLVGMKDPANPLPYHVLQWLTFALAVWLMPKALSAFSVPRPVALGATLLWLLHPFRVESVSWVANLKDAASLLGATAAFALFAANRRWASAFIFCLGLFCKASLAPLGVAFLALEVKRVGVRRGLASSLRWLLPALAVGVVAIVVHRAAVPTSTPDWGWQTPLFTPFWYLGRLLLPVGSRALYDWQIPSGLAVVGLLLAWAVLAVVALLGLRRAGAMRVVALGAGLYLLPLAPFSGLIRQAYPVAERYTLFPSLVVAVAVAWLLVRFRVAGWVALGLLTVGLLPLTVARQREWRDGLTLWTSNVDLAPGSVNARLNLAGTLGRDGRFSEAITQLKEVRRLEPNRPGLDCYFAMARAGKERLDPTFAVNELGSLCQLPYASRWTAALPIVARRDASARVVVEELAFGPDRAKAAAAAAAFALERHELDSALALATQALAWDPSLERALITQVVALLRLERFDDAAAISSIEVKDPRVAARLLGLRAAVLNERGQFAEAEALLRQSQDRLRALGERTEERSQGQGAPPSP